MLDDTLRDCNDLCCYLDALESAGLDVSEWRVQCQGNQTLAERLKAVHFPNSP